MNQIHEKLSVWANLHKQLAAMESSLRSGDAQPARAMGADPSAMEVELRALKVKVDTAFNAASAAIHNHSRSGREGPTAARSNESDRHTQPRERRVAD